MLEQVETQAISAHYNVRKATQNKRKHQNTKTQCAVFVADSPLVR
jgi:hypothetical protein